MLSYSNNRSHNSDISSEVDSLNNNSSNLISWICLFFLFYVYCTDVKKVELSSLVDSGDPFVASTFLEGFII